MSNNIDKAEKIIADLEAKRAACIAQGIELADGCLFV
jgi:hypothetical protein